MQGGSDKAEFCQRKISFENLELDLPNADNIPMLRITLEMFLLVAIDVVESVIKHCDSWTINLLY